MAREKLAQRETSRIMVSLYVVGEVIGVTISLKWASISDRLARYVIVYLDLSPNWIGSGYKYEII